MPTRPEPDQGRSSERSLIGNLTIELLGPFRVLIGGRQETIPAGRQRALLAVLAVSPGEFVSIERIAQAVWGEQRPADTKASVHTLVTRLRGRIGADKIDTTPSGYRLAVQPESVDVATFLALTGGEGDMSRAGLGLWRGEPFAGVDSAYLHEVVGSMLTETHLRTVERSVDDDLDTGRTPDLAGELPELAARHPFRESLWQRLIVMLDRSGRPAEALQRYDEIRSRIAEELGTDPGPELRQVHAKLLAADSPSGAPARQVPRQLPLDDPRFTGRTTELADLDRLAERTTDAGHVVLAVLHGIGGVGKTTLAVHWAHHARERFPDGDVYINLRGYGASTPVGPAVALERLLRAAGVPGDQVPTEPEERSALWRTTLADRRMLVVLDNARDAAQVRPLLPGSGSMVIVTSRSRLSGLAAREAAVQLHLDQLSPTDSNALLNRAMTQAVAAEDTALAELAELCGHLPLALVLAAVRVASEPQRGLAGVAADLRDERHRLAVFETEDDAAMTVRAVFASSYQALPDDAARMFRLLGLHPGLRISPEAASALADVPTPVGRRLLERLASTHLVEPHDSQYGMHDLLRSYAAETCEQIDPAADRESAIDRLLDHYLSTVSQAMNAVAPDTQHHRPKLTPRRVAAEFDEADAALAWLDQERLSLLAVAQLAEKIGRDEYLVKLARTVHRYLNLRSHYTDALTLITRARNAASRIGDVPSHAVLMTYLGTANEQLGRDEDAAQLFRDALEEARAQGDKLTLGLACNALGRRQFLRGEYADAVDLLEETLSLAAETGDRVVEAHALNNLGGVFFRQGNYHQAEAYCRRTLQLRREIGDRAGEVDALNNLGFVCTRLERSDEALDIFRESLLAAQSAGYRNGEASALHYVGAIHLRVGAHGDAMEALQASLKIARETGARSTQMAVLNALGETHLAADDPFAAIATHREVLGIGLDRFESARALAGQAAASLCLGDISTALQLWREALRGYEELGVPEADVVRARLAELDPPS
ncbi:AfsR/SARP family transcriptional regulator [Luteipulveratus mongoliensis]|uniref:AfsR/SARP family transcriptional regulator n=1 Tax=Luteipulveratus mongoliensis TaxID=571913 RepID=UPI000698B1AE|nr:tetratricopeptide repeat protein [Luteipulveratus mongoliensis]